jgi:hypothetical protein
MGKRLPSTKKEPQDTSSGQVAETRLKPSGQIVVEHHSTPPVGPADKQIHPRRRLPIVPNAASHPPKEDEKDI